jgi:hypothetical protein
MFIYTIFTLPLVYVACLKSVSVIILHSHVHTFYMLKIYLHDFTLTRLTLPIYSYLDCRS